MTVMNKLAHVQGRRDEIPNQELARELAETRDETGIQEIIDGLKSKDQKIEFLRNYIVQELLYDSAKRKGLDKDKEVREGILMAEKSLMAQKLLQQEIEADVKPENYSNADVELYYKANKEKYAEKDDKGNVKKIPPFSKNRIHH